ERETKNKLAKDPFFDVRRRTLYGDSDAVREFDRRIDAIFKEEAEGDFVDWRAFACECSSSKMQQEISALDTLRETEHDFYSFFVEEQKLFVPNIPRELASRLREFDEIHWATQPFPSPREDYIFKLEEYLMGVIPDQYSISHWGHGINSYSLNFRFAIEELAVLGQVAWYGAYNDPESCIEAWNEMATYMDEIIQMKQREFSGKPRKRDVVILFSDFRSDSSGVWERRKNPVSLEDEWIRVLESGFLKDITQFMRGRA
ncbi:MAG: hypothetical protein ACKO5V_07245, partial [Actinomycetota bacterium]